MDLEVEELIFFDLNLGVNLFKFLFFFFVF
jgi:hypothetical protein